MFVSLYPELCLENHGQNLRKPFFPILEKQLFENFCAHKEDTKTVKAERSVQTPV